MSMSFQEFAGFWRLPYLSVAEKWAAVFGKENVLIRLNGRDDVPWDIVSDFANLIGMELDDAFPNRQEDKNRGISGNLLFVKRVLNCFITRKESILYRQEVWDLACLDSSFLGKLPVDQEMIDLIAGRSREELERLQYQFGLQVRPRASPVEAPPCPDQGNLGRDFARILTDRVEREKWPWRRFWSVSLASSLQNESFRLFRVLLGTGPVALYELGALRSASSTSSCVPVPSTLVVRTRASVAARHRLSRGKAGFPIGYGSATLNLPLAIPIMVLCSKWGPHIMKNSSRASKRLVKSSQRQDKKYLQ